MAGLRVLMFDVYFVLLTLALGFVGLIVRALRPTLAFTLARLWAGLTIAGLRRIAGVRFAVTGRENLPPGPLIIASQHRSELDALVWFTILDRPAYVMKHELQRLPLVGPLLVPAGMIAIDRSGGGRALRRLIRDADVAIRDGRQLIVFPEGTRVPPGQTVPLGPGIAALAGRGAPIIPVATNSGLVWGRSVLGSRRPGGPVVSIAIGSPLPERLKRETIISAIQTSWSQAQSAPEYQTVDKSVGGARGTIAAHQPLSIDPSANRFEGS